MAAQILSLFDYAPRAPRDWSQQELAEFYRVEHALLQAGVQLETDRGLSDEGEPWFVFCRGDSGEVFLHFALIDGAFVADGAAFERPQWGADFALLIKDLIARYPMQRAEAHPLSRLGGRGKSNILLHPAALLVALVGAAYFHSNGAQAAETHEPAKSEPRRASMISSGPAPTTVALAPAARTMANSDADQAAAVILSAVLSLREDFTSGLTGLALTPVHTSSPDPRTAHDLSAPPALLAVTAAHDAVAPPTPAISDAHPAGGAVTIQAASVVPATAPPTVLSAASAPEHSDGVPILAIGGATSDATLEGPTVAYGDKPLYLAHVAPAMTLSTEAVAAANAAANADGLGNIVNKGVPQVDYLPDNLVDLIDRGEHHASAPPTAPVSAGGVPGAASGDGLVPVPAAHDPVIDASIALFLASVTQLDVISQGNQLILIDHGIFGPADPNQNLASVTYTFSDGSSVSLVGTSAEITHSLGA